VLRAALAQIDPVVTDVDLGIHHHLADRADGLGVFQEDLVTVALARGSPAVAAAVSDGVAVISPDAAGPARGATVIAVTER
jgi:hypothetical protein